MRNPRVHQPAVQSRGDLPSGHAGDVKNSKGRENEAKVKKALEILKEQGYIESFFVSAPNDARDKKGIDAGLMSVHGIEINFQIKSSERGVRKHLRKHPDIPCLNLCGYVFPLDVSLLIRTQFELAPPFAA